MAQPYTFKRDLFVTDIGAAMMFNVQGCSDSKELTKYVEYGGGCVDQDSGPYTITLQDEDRPNSTPSRDVFLPRFIETCCTQNKIVKLSQHRGKSQSLFSAEFNPNDVLLRKINWNEATKKYRRNSEEPSTSGTSVSNGSSLRRDNLLTKAVGPRHSTTARCEFTQRERNEIVSFIINAKGFKDLKGTALWKKMQRKFPNHTWQSLKNHFLKKILPLIGSYKLAPEVLKAFKSCNNSGHNRKPGKSMYSLAEDTILLQYTEKSGRQHFGGNEFWKRMESKKVLPDRSWSSMRERYLKHLRGKTSAQLIKANGGLPATLIESSDSDNDDGDGESPHSARIRKSSSSSQESEPGMPSEETAKSPKKRGKKKLFTASSAFDTPSKEDAQWSPISASKETRKGVSMLECLVRKRDEEAKAKRARELRVIRKKLRQESGNRVETENGPDAVDTSASHHQENPDLQEPLSTLCASPGDVVDVSDEEDALSASPSDRQAVENAPSDGQAVENTPSDRQEVENSPSDSQAVGNTPSDQLAVGNGSPRGPVESDEDFSDWSNDGMYYGGATCKDSQDSSHANKESEPGQCPLPKATRSSAREAPTANRPPASSPDRVAARKEPQRKKDCAPPHPVDETCVQQPLLAGAMDETYDFLQHISQVTLDIPVCSSTQQTADETHTESQPLAGLSDRTYVILPHASQRSQDTLDVPLPASTQYTSESQTSDNEIDSAPKDERTVCGSCLNVDVGTQVRFAVDVAVQTDPVIISYTPESTRSTKEKRCASDPLVSSLKAKRVSFSPFIGGDNSPVSAALSPAGMGSGRKSDSNRRASPSSPKYNGISKL